VPIIRANNARNSAEKTRMRECRNYIARDRNPRHLSPYAQRVLRVGIMESNTSLINKPALMYARNTRLSTWGGFAQADAAADVIQLFPNAPAPQNEPLENCSTTSKRISMMRHE